MSYKYKLGVIIVGAYSGIIINNSLLGLYNVQKLESYNDKSIFDKSLIRVHGFYYGFVSGILQPFYLLGYVLFKIINYKSKTIDIDIKKVNINGFNFTNENKK